MKQRLGSRSLPRGKRGLWHTEQHQARWTAWSFDGDRQRNTAHCARTFSPADLSAIFLRSRSFLVDGSRASRWASIADHFVTGSAGAVLARPLRSHSEQHAQKEIGAKMQPGANERRKFRGCRLRT